MLAIGVSKNHIAMCRFLRYQIHLVATADDSSLNSESARPSTMPAYGFSRRGMSHDPVRQRAHPPRMSPNTKTDGSAGDFVFGDTIVPPTGSAEEVVVTPLYPHTG